MNTQSVLIVGTGLLGTSLALRLTDTWQVWLSDISPAAAALARDMGAGSLYDGKSVPDLVVVCAPPDVAGQCVVAAMRRYPSAVVTDVASVKQAVAKVVEEEAEDRTNYIGSHPMAGRERSGASAADRDLFEGCPWVLVPTKETSERALGLVRSVAVEVGAVPSQLSAPEHDQAVALVSHVPQLVSSLLAGRLKDAPARVMSLAGQGLRDTTRIARSDAELWAAIVAHNSDAVAEVLEAFARDLAELRQGLAAGLPAGLSTPGRMGSVAKVMLAGNDGVERIPGKHGGAPRRYLEVSVLVPDKPGELGRLFTEIGEEQVNIEDFSLEHSAGAAAGVARLLVMPSVAQPLASALVRRGWQVPSAMNRGR